MRHTAVAVFIGLSACAGATVPVQAPVAPADAAEISAIELRRDLFAFADDSMRGRETGTDDALRAARFLSDRLQRLGLEPAGDSMYLQRVPLQRESFTPTSRIAVFEDGRAVDLRIGVDVIPLVNLGPGIPPAKRSASGEIVFAGYGMAISSPRRDDLAGLDLEGKVVVVVNGAPAGVDSATRANLEAESAISERLARILPQRPAAVIILLTGSGGAMFAELLPQLRSSVSHQGAETEIPDSERPLPMILLGSPRAGSPLLPRGWPSDDRPQGLGRQLSAQVTQERVPFTAHNVIAVARGSDPALAGTYVALGAHYDHIGVLPAINGDSIANGADDDGSGSVSLLAIARSLMSAPRRPRRSTLFVWHTGEEKGLLGSSWFVDHPTVPIDSVVAQVNADMIGRNAASLLYVVGPRVAPNGQSVRLGAVLDSVNAAQPLPFAFNREWDSLTHPEHIYERSDHFSYARMGIPIVFLTTGLHEDYHKPSDEAAKVDYEKLARVSRLMRDLVIAIGNGARPR